MKTIEQYCTENSINFDVDLINTNNDILIDYCNENDIDYLGDVLNDYYEFDESLIKLCLDGKLTDKIYNVPVNQVAFALALRIVDEWNGFDDNKVLLQNSLETMFNDNPAIGKSLWDNGIIESDYFEDL